MVSRKTLAIHTKISIHSLLMCILYIRFMYGEMHLHMHKTATTAAVCHMTTARPPRETEKKGERIETRTPNPSVCGFFLHFAAFAGVCVHLYLCLFVYVEELECVTTSASLLMCTWCIWEPWICVRLSTAMNNPESRGEILAILAEKWLDRKGCLCSSSVYSM